MALGQHGDCHQSPSVPFGVISENCGVLGGRFMLLVGLRPFHRVGVWIGRQTHVLRLPGQLSVYMQAWGSEPWVGLSSYALCTSSQIEENPAAVTSRAIVDGVSYVSRVISAEPSCRGN